LYPRSVLTLKEQALVPGKYVTMDEIKALREGKPWTPIDTTPEFAEGGLVRYNPAEIDVMVDELRTMVYG